MKEGLGRLADERRLPSRFFGDHAGHKPSPSSRLWLPETHGLIGFTLSRDAARAPLTPLPQLFAEMVRLRKRNTRSSRKTRWSDALSILARDVRVVKALPHVEVWPICVVANGLLEDLIPRGSEHSG